MPTVPTFAVRETDVSRHNGGTSGAPLKPRRDDSVLRALSSLRGLRGAPQAPPLCRETQSLGQHMLELSCETATVGKNGLNPQYDSAVMVGELLKWFPLMPRDANLSDIYMPDRCCVLAWMESGT